MKIFVSWSGELSRQVALLLRHWLPGAIQALEQPWVSDVDIEVGANWGATIGKQLTECKFGIICVTQENQSRPWLNFEAGAISRLVSKAAPLLIDFEDKSDLVGGPLTQLQAILADKDGMQKLLSDISSQLVRPLTDNQLSIAFETYPTFSRKLEEIKGDHFAWPAPRNMEDKVSEILQIVRQMAGGPDLGLPVRPTLGRQK